MSFDLERDHVGKGWQPLIEKLHAELLKLDPDYTIDQIKEKFGTLRYYIYPSEDLPDNTRSQMYNLTLKAEAESGEICETCGRPGTNQAIRGWWTTLCDEHREAQEKARAERLKNKE